jgi:hypothetical protein
MLMAMRCEVGEVPGSLPKKKNDILGGNKLKGKIWNIEY